MDDLHRHLFTVLMDREWKHGVTAAVDVTLLSRFYERFADHAVEVARRVIFQVTGKLPEDDEIPPRADAIGVTGAARSSPGMPSARASDNARWTSASGTTSATGTSSSPCGDEARQFARERSPTRRRRCPRP